jgi:hypothetical protein
MTNGNQIFSGLKVLDLASFDAAEIARLHDAGAVTPFGESHD